MKFWRHRWFKKLFGVKSTVPVDRELTIGDCFVTELADSISRSTDLAVVDLIYKPYFENALKETLEFEGVFSDHRYDSGGKTKYGITEKDARAFGYAGKMKDLTLPTAKAIYYKKYWLPCNLSSVAVISQELANEVFDTGVNMGIGRNRKMLQRSLNLFNRKGKSFRNLKVDGSIGKKTLEALNYLKGKDELRKLVMILNLLQGYKYIEFCENNETQEIFFRGWFKRVFKEWNE